MTRVKDTVRAELEKAAAWLSTNDFVRIVGRPHGSVGRALRRLWTEDVAAKTKMVGDRYGRMEWATVANAKDPNFAHAQPPKGTVYQKKSKKTKKSTGGSATVVGGFGTASQGDLIVQFEQGVETIVAELVAAEKTFSAHDITVELRDRVNAGTIQIDSNLAGTVQVAGKTVPKVEHSFIRDAVKALMRGNRFPDYTTQANPAGYIEYLPIAKSAGQTPDPVAPDPVDGTTYDGGSTL